MSTPVTLVERRPLTRARAHARHCLMALWLKALWLNALWLEALWLKALWLKALWLKALSMGRLKALK